MPYSSLNKTEKRFQPIVALSASIAYSDEFLIENLPNKEPYIGAGDVETISRSLRAVGISSRVWPKKEEPYIQADLLGSKEQEVRELIYQAKTSSIRCRERLANRLLALFKDSKEEDPYGPGITADSIRNFIKFLQLHTNLRYPSISLTPEYNIYASWKDEQSRVFSVHFLPNGNVRFVIFKPNHRHPEQKTRIAGTTTTDVLMETVSPHEISEWVLE